MVARNDPDPKALACYGLLVRQWDDAGQRAEELLLRFVDGRPVSAITTQFLDWCCTRLAAQEKKALLLVWDNASWHVSQAVRQWIGAHNRAIKEAGVGVRIVSCCLPVKSPWLNPIEPKWLHGKRWIVEPARLLTANDVAERVCAGFGCIHETHLSLPQKVA
jgi:transposase